MRQMKYASKINSVMGKSYIFIWNHSMKKEIVEAICNDKNIIRFDQR